MSFKSGKDETSCVALVCFLSLSMWHSAVCNKESYISLEWISLQELSWLSAQGSPCLSSTGRRMKVNASVLPVILKLAWTALHCFTQKKEPCIFWHIFQYQVPLFNSFLLDFSFNCTVMMISNIILILWWLTVTFPVRQDTGFSGLFKGPTNPLSNEGSSFTVRKNEDETVTIPVYFNSYSYFLSSFMRSKFLKIMWVLVNSHTNSWIFFLNHVI